MTKRKKSKVALPSMSTLIILVFFISFSVWAFSECQRRRVQLRSQNGRTATTTAPVTPPRTEAMPPALPRLRTDTVAASANNTTTVSTAGQGSRLYVTIDGLNLRQGPGLNSGIIRKLALFDEVYYADEVTDSTFRVNLGLQEVDEPYVKVRTTGGQVGWVYGAGVHYYKRKHPGVQ